MTGSGKPTLMSKLKRKALGSPSSSKKLIYASIGLRDESHYAGKKKRHTLKNEYVITAGGRIASVSASHPGSDHDLTIRRAGPQLPETARIYADSAYQG